MTASEKTIAILGGIVWLFLLIQAIVYLPRQWRARKATRNERCHDIKVTMAVLLLLAASILWIVIDPHHGRCGQACYLNTPTNQP